MRIAVYGGSFNPPHKAHAMVASWIVSSGVADRVWLVPVFEHAFEGVHEKALAPYEMRLAWCAAMANELGDYVEVSDVESRLSAPSYTVDTLQHFSRTYAQHTFHLVIGADILEQTSGWKSWDVIVSEFSPIVVGREGYDSHNELADGAPIFPAVSSTEVRNRLAEGGTVGDLVSPEVGRILAINNPWCT